MDTQAPNINRNTNSDNYVVTSNSHGLKRSIIGLVIILILVTIIFLFFKFRSGTPINLSVLSNNKSVSSQISATPMPINSTNNLSTWLTYSSSKYKFSLKYPNSWSLSEKGATIILRPNQNIKQNYSFFSVSSYDPSTINALITDNPTLYRLSTGEGLIDTSADKNPSKRFTQVSFDTENIDGVLGYHNSQIGNIIINPNDSNTWLNSQIDYIALKKNNIIYIIERFNGLGDTIDQDTFLNILSTFKMQ